MTLVVHASRSAMPCGPSRSRCSGRGRSRRTASARGTGSAQKSRLEAWTMGGACSTRSTGSSSAVRHFGDCSAKSLE